MGILTRFCIFKLKWSWAKRGELDIFMLFCSLFCHLNLFIYRWKVHKQFATRFYAKNLQDWRMKFEKKFRICQNSTWARLMQNSHSSDWRAEKESLRTLTGSRRPALAEFLFFFFLLVFGLPRACSLVFIFTLYSERKRQVVVCVVVVIWWGPRFVTRPPFRSQAEHIRNCFWS